MKFLVQKIDNKLTLDFCHEIMVSQIYSDWRGDHYTIKYVNESIPRDLKHPEQYIPIGTVEFVSDYVTTYFPEKVDCLKPINVPYCLRGYAGRYVWDIHNVDDISETIKDGEELYRKSLTTIKDPTNGFIKYDSNKKEELLEYQVSTKLNDIRSEWRVFVHHNKVQQVCFYDGDPLVFPESRPIMRMVEEYEWNGAPVAYTLDVAVTDYGVYVMEVHRFFSCGLYGFSDYRVLPYMFSQSWHEMMNYNHKDLNYERVQGLLA